jgi:hypothetical protein
VLYASSVSCPESLRPESVYPESLRPESVYPDSLRPESAYPDSLRPESVYPDSLRPESVYPDSLRPESVYPDSLPYGFHPPLVSVSVPLSHAPFPHAIERSHHNSLLAVRWHFYSLVPPLRHHLLERFDEL